MSSRSLKLSPQLKLQNIFLSQSKLLRKLASNSISQTNQTSSLKSIQWSIVLMTCLESGMKLMIRRTFSMKRWRVVKCWIIDKKIFNRLRNWHGAFLCHRQTITSSSHAVDNGVKFPEDSRKLNVLTNIKCWYKRYRNGSYAMWKCLEDPCDNFTSSSEMMVLIENIHRRTSKLSKTFYDILWLEVMIDDC